MSLSWCSLNHCKSDGPDADASLPEPELDVYGNSTNNASNHSNFSCHYPFCVSCLTYTIGESQVRVYDLALVFFNVLFLVLLLLNLVPTIKKLYRSFLLFKILYSMVFVIPVVTVIHGTISMAHGYTQQSAKATQVLVRGAILMTEMSVIIFGLFFRKFVMMQVD